MNNTKEIAELLELMHSKAPRIVDSGDFGEVGLLREKIDKALHSLQAEPVGAVQVCPSKDRACGEYPQGWCDTCPKRSQPAKVPEVPTKEMCEAFWDEYRKDPWSLVAAYKAMMTAAPIQTTEI